MVRHKSSFMALASRPESIRISATKREMHRLRWMWKRKSLRRFLTQKKTNRASARHTVEMMVPIKVIQSNASTSCEINGLEWLTDREDSWRPTLMLKIPLTSMMTAKLVKWSHSHSMNSSSNHESQLLNGNAGWVITLYRVTDRSFSASISGKVQDSRVPIGALLVTGRVVVAFAPLDAIFDSLAILAKLDGSDLWLAKSRSQHGRI